MLRRLVSDRAVFLTAMDQAAEAILITDPTPAIVYANPSALHSTGYDLDELVGENPRILQSGLHDAAFYEAMWSRLAGGQSWKGVMRNRRKNGEIYEEDATITPVYDESGELIAFVASKHDRTVERRLEADLSRWQSDRTAIIDLMNRVRPAESVEATAAAFCEEVTHLEGIHGAMVMLLQSDGTLVAGGSAGLHMPGFEFGRAIQVEQLDVVISATGAGPWSLNMSDPSTRAAIGDDLANAMIQLGITASGYAGIRWDDELTGVVCVATREPDGIAWLDSRLGAIEELGSFAGALFGSQAVQFSRQEDARLEVLDVLRSRRFHPVFQPVINLRTGEVSGYEALTRFDDGRPPDHRFADAHAAGIGPTLEAACAATAIEAIRHMPADVWVSINFSAAAILDGHAATVAAKANRAVVIEITEHAVIESYPAVRRAITRGGDVLLSVDDAGAGFASLRHILELDPDIVKLDIGLIRGIDADPARQALAAGMCHFALKTGTTLVAEGVETQAEADTVHELGVELAQGYLFGRPERF